MKLWPLGLVAVAVVVVGARSLSRTAATSDPPDLDASLPVEPFYPGDPCRFMDADPRFRTGAWTDRGAELDEAGNTWACAAPDVAIGSANGPLRSDIAYQVLGTSEGARLARLSLDVNVPDERVAALAQLADAAEILTKSAFGIAVPSEVAKAIRRGDTGYALNDGKPLVDLSREAYGEASSIPVGFTMRYVVTLVQ